MYVDINLLGEFRIAENLWILRLSRQWCFMARSSALWHHVVLWQVPMVRGPCWCLHLQGEDGFCHNTTWHHNPEDPDLNEKNYFTCQYRNWSRSVLNKGYEHLMKPW